MNLRRVISTIALTSAFMFGYETSIAQEVEAENDTRDEVSSSSGTARVYFMRATGFSGSAVAFKAFIDDEMVCRLNNKRYSVHEVSPGEHKFTVQFYGEKSKVKAEPIFINALPNETYYVKMIIQPGVWVNNLYCQEITESSASIFLRRLKEDRNCF